MFAPSQYDRCLRFSQIAREIYRGFTDQLEPLRPGRVLASVMIGSISLFGGGRAIADELLRRIRQELGVTASMGDSCNKTCLAKSVFWGLHLKMRIFRAFPWLSFCYRFTHFETRL